MKVAYFQDPQPTGTGPTVWENGAALQTYVRGVGSVSENAQAMPQSVAWWVPERDEPTTAEAHRRLEFIRTHGPSAYAFPAMQLRPQLSIDRVWLDDVDVQFLIAQLNADLSQRYPEPGALIFSLDPADIVDGVGALLMAVQDGRPIGCGAFRVTDDQPATAEIKRMYVVPSARGAKTGAALLTQLEERAIAIGVRRFILETGPRQPEALALYGRAGYAECEPWGEFIGKDFSICMARVVA